MPQVIRRLAEGGFRLPEALAPAGRYAPVHRHAGLLWVSGHTGRGADRPALSGIVGLDLTLEQARAEAERAALNLLAAVSVHLAASDHLGLDLVAGPVSLRGYVRCASDFGAQPAVIDAASAVFDVAFGESARSARTALGVEALPGGACVELEAVFALAAGH